MVFSFLLNLDHHYESVITYFSHLGGSNIRAQIPWTSWETLHSKRAQIPWAQISEPIRNITEDNKHEIKNKAGTRTAAELASKWKKKA